MLEQARWAARGGRSTDRRHLADTLSAFSRIAADNPDAWFPTAWTADDLVSTAGGNRPIVTPYRKRMVAFPDVDMAAANLLVTHEVADRWGVPPTGGCTCGAGASPATPRTSPPVATSPPPPP